MLSRWSIVARCYTSSVQAGNFAFPMMACLIVCFISEISAADSQPVKVINVESGLRLTVEGHLGGLPIAIPVQLTNLALMGPAEQAQQKLTELCPVGVLVVLHTEAMELKADAFGVVHAVVLRDFPGPVDPAAPPIAARTPGAFRSSIQIEMMRAGWGYLSADTADRGMSQRELSGQAQQAMKEARERTMGAYSLPGFTPPLEMAGRQPGMPQRGPRPMPHLPPGQLKPGQLAPGPLLPGQHAPAPAVTVSPQPVLPPTTTTDEPPAPAPTGTGF